MAASIPFELKENLILLTAETASGGPLTFLLETGAGMTVIDEQTARARGIEAGEAVEVMGAAGGSALRLARAPVLHLGPAQITGLQVGITSLERVREKLGRHFDGLLGYDVLRRFVVDLDYAARIVHFHDAESYSYSGSGEVLPFTLGCGALVHVSGEVVHHGGVRSEGKFVIDTGAGGRAALVLTAPFVKEHRLPEPGRKMAASGSAGHGVGGAVTADIGRVEQFQIGRFQVDNPVTVFSRDTQGFLSRPGRAGIIGNEILRRFRLIINYARNRVALEKNGHFGEPFEEPRTGGDP